MGRQTREQQQHRMGRSSQEKQPGQASEAASACADASQWVGSGSQRRQQSQEGHAQQIIDAKGLALDNAPFCRDPYNDVLCIIHSPIHSYEARMAYSVQPLEPGDSPLRSTPLHLPIPIP
jgi:hypothetical protein